MMPKTFSVIAMLCLPAPGLPFMLPLTVLWGAGMQMECIMNSISHARVIILQS